MTTDEMIAWLTVCGTTTTDEAAAALRRLGKLERVLSYVEPGSTLTVEAGYDYFWAGFSGEREHRADTPLAALLALAEELPLD